MEAESWFVVEKDDPEAPKFFGVNTSAQCFTWRNNRRHALRFSRRVDAQNILAALNWPELTNSHARVVEYSSNDWGI